MASLRSEIAGDVALEVVAIDDDGLGCLVLGGVLLRYGVGLLVDYENHSLGIWRPRELRNATAELGDALRLAAATIEQPNLRALTLLSSGEEREIASVRTPARRTLTFRARRHANRRRAVPARHPDVVIGLVLRRIDGRHGVRDPTAVGRDLRIANILKLVEIAATERPFRLRVGRCCVKAEQAGDREQCKRGGDAAHDNPPGGVRPVVRRMNRRAKYRVVRIPSRGRCATADEL